MVTPIGLESIGGHYFWIWAVICALFIPLIYFVSVLTISCSLIMLSDVDFCSSAWKPRAAHSSRWIRCSSTSRVSAWA